MLTEQTPTVLTRALWPQTGALRNALLVVAGTLLVALTAQIRLQIGPVPLTGQTFGVLLVAAVLGRRAVWSMLLYLGGGLAGLPFFAGAGLAGPTGGYLVGFVVAAYVVGWLCERGWDRRMETAVLAMLLGNIVIYVLGIVWLARFMSWDAVWQAGLLPFIPGDVFKILLAAALLPLAWRTLTPKT